jgi:hypothetical protein
MLPTIDALKAQWKGDRLMRKNSTVAKNGNKIFKQPALTIGLDLGIEAAVTAFWMRWAM